MMSKVPLYLIQEVLRLLLHLAHFLLILRLVERSERQSKTNSRIEGLGNLQREAGARR